MKLKQKLYIRMEKLNRYEDGYTEELPFGFEIKSHPTNSSEYYWDVGSFEIEHDFEVPDHKTRVEIQRVGLEQVLEDLRARSNLEIITLENKIAELLALPAPGNE